MKERILKGKGVFDYDYVDDIIFFKVKSRDYERSMELDNIVIDIDKKKFIVGIQIFEASKFLKIPKVSLRKILNWKFVARVNEKRIEIRLTFQVKIRNKIIERSPIILQPVKKPLPNSEMICKPK